MKEQQNEKQLRTEQRGCIHFDYKNVELLAKNINAHARMHSRRRSGLTSREQRSFAEAVKRARFMALMPYISR